MLTRFSEIVAIATLAMASSVTLGQAQSTSTSTGTSAAKSNPKAAEMAKKPLASVTCEEFNALDESFKPTVIAWAAGYRQGEKKPDVVAVDVRGVEQITPVVVDECRKAPTTSFWSKVEAELKKHL